MTGTLSGRERGAMPIAVTTMSHRFADLAASAKDPSITGAATPPWSIADVVGHVGAEAVRYRELVLGRGQWPARVPELPAFNASRSPR